MTTSLTQILLLTLIPVVATFLGGVVASFRPPGPRVRSFVQHFAAGVVFAAVAGELLPQITAGREPLGVVIGFALGVGVMLSVRALVGRLEPEDDNGQDTDAAPRAATGLLAAVGIDILIDGLLIGVGFAAGERVGTLLVVALTLELLFLGLSVAASLGQRGASRGRSILTVGGLSLLVIVGAALGGTLLQGLSGLPLEIVLSFGAAALLFLVTEELLVEAHEVKETPWITSAFFLGFIALYLIELGS
ncbi:ZIP family metal transporter [Deinococcus humi]|uniref:ZIP family zinc transporter n=1 Tax=Deinococcus humi TaxID=662880 RepID=A0A7W8NFB1_9DEIO|nr:transporter [Deinococcus humi]MBB5362608.1 ZIP family zinc transporter [Deinococcus humi]GGO31409.1 membrane protein [Deinococcus humi]